MPHIQLYVPGSDAPEEFDVENYKLENGVLSFRVDKGRHPQAQAGAVRVKTTVPFMIWEKP
jgi:hypothetical protein